MEHSLNYAASVVKNAKEAAWNANHAAITSYSYLAGIQEQLQSQHPELTQEIFDAVQQAHKAARECELARKALTDLNNRVQEKEKYNPL
jgi:hypothetical protein